MPKRIPFATAKAVGKKHSDVTQVILLAWDGERTHVVTWGKSVEDCAQAADGGNAVKRLFKWPEELCKDEPNRVKKLRNRIAELEEQLEA